MIVLLAILLIALALFSLPWAFPDHWEDDQGKNLCIARTASSASCAPTSPANSEAGHHAVKRIGHPQCYRSGVYTTVLACDGPTPPAVWFTCHRCRINYRINKRRTLAHVLWEHRHCGMRLPPDLLWLERMLHNTDRCRGAAPTDSGILLPHPDAAPWKNP